MMLVVIVICSAIALMQQSIRSMFASSMSMPVLCTSTQRPRLHQPLYHGEGHCEAQEPTKNSGPQGPAPCLTAGTVPHMQRHWKAWHGFSHKPANDTSAPHWICPADDTVWQAHSRKVTDIKSRRLHQPTFPAPSCSAMGLLPRLP